MLNYLIRTWRSGGEPPAMKWGTRAIISFGVTVAACLVQLSTWPAAIGDPMLGVLKSSAGVIYDVAEIVGLAAMASTFVCILMSMIARRRQRLIETNDDPLVRAAREMDDADLNVAIAALHHSEHQLLAEGRIAEAKAVTHDKFVLLSVRDNRAVRGTANDSRGEQC